MAMACKICTESFDSGERLPKLIQCGHTVCLKCLQDLPSLMCPICRKRFRGPVTSLNVNYALLELLHEVIPQVNQNRTDENTARGWCFKCRTTASSQCWAQDDHDVLAVSAALERSLQDVLPALPQAAGELEALKDREEQALHALTLLSGSAWGLALCRGDQLISGTLRDTRDPMTQAMLLLVAAKAELKEDKKRNPLFTVHFQMDLGDDEATNLKIVSGVDRLLNVYSSDATQELLQAAAPTVQQLSMCCPSPAVLRATQAMPRLQRLRVESASSDFTKGKELEDLQQLPGLQWLELKNPNRAVLVMLLRASQTTLKVLQLDSEGCSATRMSCDKLFSLLEQCNLRALRRLVLRDVLSSLFVDNETHQRQKCDCYRQRGVVRRALPADAEVLCARCDQGGEKTPMEDF